MNGRTDGLKDRASRLETTAKYCHYCHQCCKSFTASQLRCSWHSLPLFWWSDLPSVKNASEQSIYKCHSKCGSVNVKVINRFYFVYKLLQCLDFVSISMDISGYACMVGMCVWLYEKGMSMRKSWWHFQLVGFVTCLIYIPNIKVKWEKSIVLNIRRAFSNLDK